MSGNKSIIENVSCPFEPALLNQSRLIAFWGKPQSIVCDNEPEFTCGAMQDWSKKHNIHLQFIEPGKPMQNALQSDFHLVGLKGCGSAMKPWPPPIWRPPIRFRWLHRVDAIDISRLRRESQKINLV
jgi:hypothetical protein